MIIGVTGWFASGKDTVSDYLEEKGYIKISLSDIIREHCTKRGLDHTRDNTRAVGNALREEFGPDYLAQEALKVIESSGSDKNFVIPSIRQTAEVRIFRQNPNFQLWEVYAPAETRYSRLIKRARTEDEKDITFQDFIQKEEVEKGGSPNCQEVDRVIELVDLQIDNSGDISELKRNIDKLLEV